MNATLGATALTDEDCLRLFCDRVAGCDSVDMALGYPANVFDLRQFVDVHSDTYFFAIALKVLDLVDDSDLRASSLENASRWRRLIGMRVADGQSLSVIRRMIEVLQLERLTIEYGLSRGAFRFGKR